MKKLAIISWLCLFTGAVLAERKPTWPVSKLTFTIKDKSGWTPSAVTVPKGAEVRVTLENKSDAPACFEIGDKKGKFVQSPVCVDVDEQQQVTFFANVESGSYPIRNRWEQQSAGTFTVR